MAMDVTQILLNAQSPDGGIRKLAEDSLTQLQQRDPAAFVLSLSLELANPAKPLDSRRLAGLILKNSLDAKEEARKAQLSQAWLGLDPGVKSQVKASLLATLPTEARHAASQAIAKLAAIELPHGEWPELIATLLANMAADSAPGGVASILKQATLETLGYVCEEVPPEVLAQDQVNAVLTAVVRGMNASGGADVVLAATKALYNALDFAQSNFENEMERNYIMSVVCEAAASADARVRQAALECLVSVASSYYEKLQPYMQHIFAITSKAVKEDSEPVALQAIEFWSSVCDEEIEIQEEWGPDFAGDADVPYFQFIKHALPTLVTMLLDTLTKQEEEQEQEEGAWNLAMAGGTCLGLIARVVSDDIVPLVLPYVEENMLKPNWRNREAATYAFGSILEGPSPEKLAPLVNLALNFMLSALKDENNHVKDTTAWTLGRIFEFLHQPEINPPIITEENLPLVVGALLESLGDSPNVAEKACGALYFLAQGYEEMGGKSSPLSPFFPRLVQGLLLTAEREDASESRLRASAYETLNEIIRCSAEDSAAIVTQLVPAILQKLSQTLEMAILSSDDREKQSDLQALLCGVLQVIIQKLAPFDATNQCILQYADQMIHLFLGVFACRSATVHEEAMLAIGALAYATGEEFEKHMPAFYKYLETGLRNFEEYQVCSITVGVVGDICRALDIKVLPYCDGIMTELLKALSSNQLHCSVKPPIFSCFGDIALAIGSNFDKYLMYAMPMLQTAAEVSTQSTNSDDEIAEYNIQLKVGILEAYSGIFQGFKNTKADLMLQYSGLILQFIGSIYQDKERDETVAKAAVGVLGDLADTLGSSAIVCLRNAAFYKDFLVECLTSEDQQLRETAEWAQTAISRIFF